MHDLDQIQDHPEPQAQGALMGAVAKLAGETRVEAESVTWEPIKSNVYRLRLEARGQDSCLIAKRMDPVVAQWTELTARRWLPSVGLGELGPPLLAVAAERDGRQVWHLYEDLGDCSLDTGAPDPDRLGAAMARLALLHGSCADHPVLADCHIRGAFVCVTRYTTNLLDAICGLDSAPARSCYRTGEHRVLRDELLACLHGLLEDAPRREAAMAEFGGPWTLLHGDLWPSNVLVWETDHGVTARFIDWDHVGPGPASYDLSTIVSRLSVEWRPMAVDLYRRAMAPFAMALPGLDTLNLLFDTAERARIVYCIIWSALAVVESEADWGYESLRAQRTWLQALAPLLPVCGEAGEVARSRAQGAGAGCDGPAEVP
jgi:hypothetical protein